MCLRHLEQTREQLITTKVTFALCQGYLQNTAKKKQDPSIVLRFLKSSNAILKLDPDLDKDQKKFEFFISQCPPLNLDNSAEQNKELARLANPAKKLYLNNCADINAFPWKTNKVNFMKLAIRNQELLEVKRSPGKGEGVFAKDDFEELFVPYIGTLDGHGFGSYAIMIEYKGRTYEAVGSEKPVHCFSGSKMNDGALTPHTLKNLNSCLQTLKELSSNKSNMAKLKEAMTVYLDCVIDYLDNEDSLLSQMEHQTDVVNGIPGFTIKGNFKRGKEIFIHYDFAYWTNKVLLDGLTNCGEEKTFKQFATYMGNELLRHAGSGSFPPRISNKIKNIAAKLREHAFSKAESISVSSAEDDAKWPLHLAFQVKHLNKEWTSNINSDLQKPEHFQKFKELVQKPVASGSLLHPAVEHFLKAGLLHFVNKRSGKAIPVEEVLRASTARNPEWE